MRTAPRRKLTMHKNVLPNDFSCENESLHEFCSDLWDLGRRVAKWKSTPAVLEQIEWLKIHGFNLEGDNKTRNNVGAVFKVVDQVVAKKCQSGIAVVELGTIEVNTLAAFYAEQKHSIKNTVNIWIDCEPEFNQFGGLKVFLIEPYLSELVKTEKSN